MAAQVLMIEDDEAVSFMYSLALRDAGWEVAVAADGAAGLEAAMSALPAIVVLDMGLPKLNGAEVLDRLRGDPRTAAVPVLVLSNSEVSEWRDAARRLGGRWLLKSRTTPIDLARRLVAEIGKPEERRRQPRRLDDVLRLLEATAASSTSELPTTVAAVLTARGVDVSSLVSIEALRASVARAAASSPRPTQERRRQIRRQSGA